MHRQQDQGMYAEDIRRGTLISGRRVAAMARGTLNGAGIVTVRFEERDRKGRKRLSAAATYRVGTRVPGTRRPTTWAMPAGPVKSGGRPMLLGKVGRGDDESAADRNSRLIASVVYG